VLERTRTAGSSRSWEFGQSLAEFGLILPVLLILVLGAVDVGRVYYEDVQIRNAARNGTSYGSGSSTSAIDHAGIRAAAVDGITVSGSPTVSDSVAADASGGQSLRVSVQSDFTTLIAWPGLPHHLTLQHAVEARVLQ
jgi:Flp pilus assembly protein TadG